MKNKVRILMALFAILSFLGCSGQAGTAPAIAPDALTEEGSPEPTPTPRPVGQAVAADGYLASPYPKLALGFGGGISGEVLTITVQAGDVVAAGDLLAQLKVGDLELAAADAERALERAETDRERAQAQWERDVADAEQALANAERARSQAGLQYSDTSVEEARTALERARQAEIDAKKAYDNPLFGDWTPDDEREREYEAWQNAIRERELAEMRLADAEDSRGSSYLDLESRRGSVEQAERKLATLQEGLEPSYDRAVEDAELKLEKAQSDLEKARLVAPWDAQVLSIEVAPQAAVSAGTPVVTLLSMEDGLRFVTESLSEQHVTNVHAGQRAVVTLRSFPQSPIAGVVEAVVPQVRPDDAAATDARFTVRVRLSPTELRLLPGLTGRVEIFTE